MTDRGPSVNDGFMSSLYQQCVNEKYGYYCVEDAEGFFTYSVGKVFVVREFYVTAAKRTMKKYLEYVKIMDEAAKAHCFKEYFITVFIDAKNGLAENTLALAIRHGFKLVPSQDPGHVLLKRSL